LSKCSSDVEPRVCVIHCKYIYIFIFTEKLGRVCNMGFLLYFPLATRSLTRKSHVYYHHYTIENSSRAAKLAPCIIFIDELE
jgi:hypothetical protein